MSLGTILVTAVIAVLLGLAVRYLARNGACSACSDAKSCRGNSCGGECGGCPHCGAESRSK
ncbi:FeoB-associated Cys-rich membrane protein [Caproiciproducens sp. NJN-50]|uniref:FeoB-associated Cys-rich membrane protein n=1 Tax=Acutalibacteraceae TaxID=3082771 RepID=UPI000FFE2561|nr:MULTISPECIES: FeoB-associated Cys-rich membrane protein [Acutalibacteraceae]QAT49266.1 FeoB-associated Cys-rich membrane protein [Caproiciproducens sp. NJN-50]